MAGRVAFPTADRNVSTLVGNSRPDAGGEIYSKCTDDFVQPSVVSSEPLFEQIKKLFLARLSEDQSIKGERASKIDQVAVFAT